VTPSDLLSELERRNIRIEAVGERIRFGPSRRVTARLRAALAQHKGQLLLLLASPDPDVSWRVAAMRPQVPLRGPIPFLVARWSDLAPGACLSCGDPLVEGRRVRCGPCVAAAEHVLQQIRESA
jgi:hypothetical protein